MTTPRKKKPGNRRGADQVGSPEDEGCCRFCGEFVHSDTDESGPHWHCQVERLTAALQEIAKLKPQMVLNGASVVGKPSAGWNFAMIARRVLAEIDA